METQIKKNWIEQGFIMRDAMQEITDIFNSLGENNFTGAFKLEFNFHKGSLSRKIKHGTIETTIFPRE